MSVATTIYFHADCLDGFGAAYAAWRIFGAEATYRPLHHGELWESAEVSGRDVFILDFAFPPDQLAAMARLSTHVTQLDHHLSAHRNWGDRLPVGQNPCIYCCVVSKIRISGASV